MVANEETVIVELFNATDIVQELTEYICSSLDEAEAEQFRNTCGSLANDGNLLELINQFYDKLGKSLTEESTVHFAVIFSLMRRLDLETLGMIIERICTDLTSSEEQAGLRLDVLHELYSVLPFNSRIRYTIFMAKLQYGARTNLQAKTMEHLDTEDIKLLIQAWELNKLEEKQLYFTVCDNLAAASVDNLDEQRILMNFLETFESSTIDEMNSVNEYAQRAVIGALKKPLLKTKDPTITAAETKVAAETFHLAAVKALESSTNELSRRSFEILKIFCEGSFAEFEEFCKKHPGQIEEFGLTEKVCGDNIRLLSLASVAEGEEAISYSKVAEVLSIEPKDVEKWVVKGITSNLIDAKLDQLEQVIVINRAPQRQFEEKQWMQLADKLKKWRGSVQTILQSVRKAREDHEKLTASMVR